MSNEFNKWIFEHRKMIKKLSDTNNQDSIKIKWKGIKVNNYKRNWQYAITKEVLGMHEIIDPYDWKLDLEMNVDFKIWQKEMNVKDDSNE